MRSAIVEGRQKLWKFLSKACKLIGALAFFGLFSTQIYLIEHWRDTRPDTPRPDLGWTVRLPWGLGAYGTAGEAYFLNACSFWCGVAFIVLSLSPLIDYYKFGIWPLRTPPKIPR